MATSKTLILYHYTKVNPSEWAAALQRGDIKSLYATVEKGNPFGYPHCITLWVELKGPKEQDFQWGVPGNRFIKRWSVHDGKWYHLKAADCQILDIFTYELKGFSL